MKVRTVCTGGLLLVAAALAVGQAAPPAPSLQTLQTEVQDNSIQLAVKDFQLSQASAQFAQQNLAQAKAHVLDVINQVKRARNLGDDWSYDFQRMAFVQAPAKPKTPPAAATKEVPPQRSSQKK